MKNRVRVGASFALCILLAVPAYAEQESQWKLVNHYLDKAEKGTSLGIYGLITACGAVAAMACPYFLITQTKQYRDSQSLENGSKADDELVGIVVGGAFIGIVGLGVMGFGIRGLKSVINGKEENGKGSENTNGIDKRVHNVMNGAKKVASFGGRMAAYSLLTLFGGVTVLGSVAPVVYKAVAAKKNTFKFDIKETVIEGTGVAVGTPLLALGLHGLIKTFQEWRAVQKKEIVDASMQTIAK